MRPALYGFDAPLPPARSGVADYAAVLLAELRKHAEIALPGGEAKRWLYHVGNNREHHEQIYKRALARPGVVVLHDAVLMHLQLSMASDEDEFAREFVYNYGGWHEQLGRTLWRNRARSAADAEYFRWPMLKRLVESAEAVIVHNAGAARRVREHAAEARVIEIPHIAFDADVSATRVEELRGEWKGSLVFGVFGHLRESKRLLPILRAFARLDHPDVRLLLAGEVQSEALERAMAPLMSERVIRLGGLSEGDLRSSIAAVDAGLSLRWPSAGETSGIAIRLMAAGKPAFLTRGEETASFPEGVCIKVDPGSIEEDHLHALFAWLAAEPEAGRKIGALAREHIARHHAPERVAARYFEVLQS